MGNGGKSQALTQLGTAQGLESTYANDATNAQNEILPFLNSEVTNPVGFGQTGVNELLTQGGQATSGAVGAGDEAAKLRASRLGNPSSSASIIDAVSRAGASQQSNNALNVNTDNLQEKLKQQQAGESGIASLGTGDMNAALGSLGLGNSATNSYIQASANTNPLNAIGGIFGDLAGIGTGIGAGVKAAGV